YLSQNARPTAAGSGICAKPGAFRWERAVQRRMNAAIDTAPRQFTCRASRFMGAEAASWGAEAASSLLPLAALEGAPRLFVHALGGAALELGVLVRVEHLRHARPIEGHPDDLFHRSGERGHDPE